MPGNISSVIALLFLVFGCIATGELSPRRASCPPKYKSIPGHSACVAPSKDAEDAGVSKADQKLILEEHLRVRRAVNPPAANMREMTWDDELANTAQAWAEHCSMVHDKNDQRTAVDGSKEEEKDTAAFVTVG